MDLRNDNLFGPDLIGTVEHFEYLAFWSSEPQPIIETKELSPYDRPFFHMYLTPKIQLYEGAGFNFLDYI